jgi:hypothetical protein
VNNANSTVRLFVKNVTDPVGEFWEKKALEQTGGVSDRGILDNVGHNNPGHFLHKSFAILKKNSNTDIFNKKRG